LHKDIAMNLSPLTHQIFLGLSSLCIINSVGAQIPVWRFSVVDSPVISVSDTGMATVRYTVHNNARKPHRLVLSTTTPPGIRQLGGVCVLAARSPENPDPTCNLTLTINGGELSTNRLFGGPTLCQANFDDTPNANQCYEPDAGDRLAITKITQPGTTTLSTSIPSPAILALSVNNQSLNPALTGHVRELTIQNTGVDTATGLTITYPTWPNGTTASSICGTTLAAGASCAIKIQPGSNATSNCSTGSVPTPGTIIVSAINVATAVTSSVVILSYGCQYQGGFLYAVDDATVNTGSIGGKVVSLVDQAAPVVNNSPQATSIIWSSNGNGSTEDDVDYTTILGIDHRSTTSAPSPTTPPYSSKTPYTACNGATDGACDSNNILSYYKVNRTKGGLTPTPVNYYAAGLCTATINTYSDWYLPAICEMDAVDSNLTGCPFETQSMIGSLSFLLGDPYTQTQLSSMSCNPPIGTDCLSGDYWSSTQARADLNPGCADFIVFASNYRRQQNAIHKGIRKGVRCSRALTF
jgi:hypothetical protein